MFSRIKSGIRFRPGLLGFAGGILFAGVVFLQIVACQNPASSAEQSLAAGGTGKDISERLNDLLPYERGIVDVIRRISPSVVNVSNLAQRRISLFSSNVEEVPRGIGTGFVWDKKGHVVTNFHVVYGADALTVTFADQTTRRAKVVGLYPKKELAVLKIDLPPEKLTPIQLGTSGDLLVGQTVLAIGNPFGFDHTLTTGVVSALGREIRALTGEPIQDVIQTDASINFGNSGGPLLDSRGRLIGVNTAIYSPSRTSAGIGFAIPVDTVKSIVTQMIETGKVVRPGLGVRLFQSEVSERLGIEGVIIARVEPRSAASLAGLRGTEETDEGEIILGDIIIGIGKKRIKSYDDLYKTLERYQVGDNVQVTYLRNNRELKTNVRLQSID